MKANALTTSQKGIITNNIQEIIDAGCQLSIEDIENLVSFRWCGEEEFGLRVLALWDLVIVFHKSVESFSKAATLECKHLWHPWEGEKTRVVEGEWIIGDGCFGINNETMHTLNGGLESVLSEYEPPVFSYGVNHVIVRRIHTHNSMSTIDEDGGNIRWEVHILPKPEKPTHQEDPFFDLSKL